AHYRSRLNFTWDSLKAAENSLNNLYREVTGFATSEEPKVGCAECEQKFLKAVNNDMDMPTALSVVQHLVKSNCPASAKLASLYKFDKVLGLDFEIVAKESAKIPEEVKKFVEERERLRDKGDFTGADKLREKIREKGFEVVDEKVGSRLKKVV
ncbi:MAG TPA: cysteine--tRNA ligase, partial [Candidatus Nanoarchaeia archaeon]